LQESLATQTFSTFSLTIDEKSDILVKFHPKTCLQIFIVCVHPDYKRQNIATNLLEASFDLAKSIGFDLISVDCTSKFTSNIAEKLSMDLVSTVTYDEYNNYLGKRLFSPLPPHTDIKTFVKAL
jgi:arylalkylamine N-acetyltransferase